MGRRKKVIPHGVGSFARCFEPYPFFIGRAKGSRVWDVDGNEYIDYIMGYGINVAGHAHPAIVNAVKEQIENGSAYTMPHEKTFLYVKELLRRFPMMDMFQFANSGTEATMHAIRVARAYTGKDKMVENNSQTRTHGIIRLSWLARGISNRYCAR